MKNYLKIVNILVVQSTSNVDATFEEYYGIV